MAAIFADESGMKEAFSISFITTAETLPLRKKVLRPFAHIEDCLNPEDDDPTTFHLGLFYAGQLICTSTFVQQSHPDLSAGFPYRLRGMATDERYRRCGYGGILLRHGIGVLRDRRCDLLWFNARMIAFNFYARMGFQFYGELFDMPRIGAHKVMYKQIIPR